MTNLRRQPDDWLLRLLPDEWIRAALGELARAEDALKRGQGRAGTAGCKRAAGMALNAALIVEPNAGWGRTYLEHVEALARDGTIPEAVRAACKVVLEARPPSGDVVSLRTPRSHEPLLEAARDVIAHAWFVVKRHETVS